MSGSSYKNQIDEPDTEIDKWRGEKEKGKQMLIKLYDWELVFCQICVQKNMRSCFADAEPQFYLLFPIVILHVHR